MPHKRETAPGLITLQRERMVPSAPIPQPQDGSLGAISPLDLTSPASSPTSSIFADDEATLVGTEHGAADGLSPRGRNLAHNPDQPSPRQREPSRRPEDTPRRRRLSPSPTRGTSLAATTGQGNSGEPSPIFSMEHEDGSLDGEAGRQRARQEEEARRAEEDKGKSKNKTKSKASDKAKDSDNDSESSEDAEQESNVVLQNRYFATGHHAPALSRLACYPPAALINFNNADDEDIYDASPVRESFRVQSAPSSPTPSSPTLPPQYDPRNSSTRGNDVYVNIEPEVTDAELLADNNYALGRTMPTVTPDGSFDYNERNVATGFAAYTTAEEHVQAAEREDTNARGRDRADQGPDKNSGGCLHDHHDDSNSSSSSSSSSSSRSTDGNVGIAAIQPAPRRFRFRDFRAAAAASAFAARSPASRRRGTAQAHETMPATPSSVSLSGFQQRGTGKVPVDRGWGLPLAGARHHHAGADDDDNSQHHRKAFDAGDTGGNGSRTRVDNSSIASANGSAAAGTSADYLAGSPTSYSSSSSSAALLNVFTRVRSPEERQAAMSRGQHSMYSEQDLRVLGSFEDMSFDSHGNLIDAAEEGDDDGAPSSSSSSSGISSSSSDGSELPVPGQSTSSSSGEDDEVVLIANPGTMIIARLANPERVSKSRYPSLYNLPDPPPSFMSLYDKEDGAEDDRSTF